jgi:hypothetical protein
MKILSIMSKAGDNLLNHFREFKDACSSDDPMGGKQRAVCETLARAGCVRQQDLIGFGIETDSMCAGDVACAR